MFEAVEEFALGLRDIGLYLRVDKSELYSPQADVSEDPVRLRLGIPMPNPDEPKGIPCAGVPVGDPDYERAEALRIATKVAADIDKVTLAFKNSPHHLWQATKLSSLSRFDYWLQHITPAATEEPARVVDEALERAVKACLRGTDVAEDPLVKRRLALPIRYMGGGLLSTWMTATLSGHLE